MIVSLSLMVSVAPTPCYKNDPWPASIPDHPTQGRCTQRTTICLCWTCNAP